MAVYDRATNTALRLITKYGAKMELYEIGKPNYDVLSPKTSQTVVIRSCPVQAIILPTSDSTLVMFDQALRKDPTITKDTRFILVAAKGIDFPPVVGLSIKTAEGLNKIDFMTPLNPTGDSPVLFRLKCTLDAQMVIP